jgi:perosamine synthetase
MKVSSKPTLTLEMFFKNVNGTRFDVFPFNTGRCKYFYSARYALAAAISALKLSSRQTVLLPSYNCWVEIDPVLRQGVKVDWYRINKDFSIDMEDIARRIRPETAAILVIHYLGFPQRLVEVRRICSERGIALIEDCAHALLSDDSGVPLGSTGDMAIFSPRKTLPLPDGGCLLINNPALTYERPEATRPNRFATYYVLSEMLRGRSTVEDNVQNLFLSLAFTLNYSMARFERLVLRVIRKVLRGSGDYLMYPSGNHFRDKVKDWGMSKSSAAIMAKADFADIKDQRRANYLFFHERFAADDRFKLPISSLPDGVCPLLFPLIVENRDQVFDELKKQGISGHDWWGDFHPAVPWHEFPDSVFMKKNILGLPVHQSITCNHMDYIIKSLGSIVGKTMISHV